MLLAKLLKLIWLVNTKYRQCDTLHLLYLLHDNHCTGKKLKLSKEDVAVVMTEMEVTKQQAEKCLRQHQGNLEEALMTLVSC